MWHFWSLVSKRVITPAPDLLAIKLAQVVSTSAPKGVTSPSPVTTTRRMLYLLAGFFMPNKNKWSQNANGFPAKTGKPRYP
jgi:hypothetical protein